MHYIYVLQDKPSVYGLPEKPTVPAGVAVWQALVKPGGSIAAAALVIGAATATAINARHRRMEKLQQVKEAGGE